MIRPFSGESPTWIRILHWEYRGHAVYDKRLKEGRSMKRINLPYKWKAYRPKSRNPESRIRDSGRCILGAGGSDKKRGLSVLRAPA